MGKTKTIGIAARGTLKCLIISGIIAATVAAYRCL